MNLANNRERLMVEARMEIEIDGQPAFLTGQSPDLQLQLGREETLQAILNSGQSLARPAANLLAKSGQTLTVSENGRTLLQIGSGTSSLFSRLFIGTPHIAPANLSAFFTILNSYLIGRRNNKT